MYCPQCGAKDEDTASSCPACGHVLDKHQRQQQEPRLGPTGQQRPAAQQYCQQPPQPAPELRSTHAYGAVPGVPSYLGWAIVTLVLCFWPTGIVAVVYASQVGNKLAVGDYFGAQESSRKARLWCWISFGIAVACLVIGTVAVVLLAPVTTTIYRSS